MPTLTPTFLNEKGGVKLSPSASKIDLTETDAKYREIKKTLAIG